MEEAIITDDDVGHIVEAASRIPSATGEYIETDFRVDQSPSAVAASRGSIGVGRVSRFVDD
jgi:hypothetical protein